MLGMLFGLSGCMLSARPPVYVDQDYAYGGSVGYGYSYPGRVYAAPRYYESRPRHWGGGYRVQAPPARRHHHGWR
jgi:hypothetical protein